MKGERSRDQAALDAPMLSQGTNQARRGSRKRRRGLVFLRNADGGPLFDSFVHLLGGEQRPDRHASEPRGICTQLGGGCGDFIWVLDNRVGGGPAVIEIPKFELASTDSTNLATPRLQSH